MGTIAHAERRINPAVCQIFLKFVMNKPIRVSMAAMMLPKPEPKRMTDAQKYREMIRLYQLSYCEKEALELARELMTSDLPASKMKDVEHVYYSCGGK